VIIEKLLGILVGVVLISLGVGMIAFNKRIADFFYDPFYIGGRTVYRALLVLTGFGFVGGGVLVIALVVNSLSS
jgi:hypothetical protein